MRLSSLLATGAVALSLGLGGVAAQAAEKPPAPSRDWTFNGMFGTFDKQQLQRGYQVYKEVCASCHSLNLVAFRNLSALGFNEDQIKALAAESTIIDGPNDEGEMFERDRIPADRLPAPFENAKAAAAANGGALPPDLSLITKARKNGPNYLYALLAEGYVEPPEDFDGVAYNKFYGGAFGMAQPLIDEGVEFADGTLATVSQQAEDVTAFLVWAAEPEMEARKQMGISALLFLLVLTGMLYALKRKIWADVEH